MWFVQGHFSVQDNKRGTGVTCRKSVNHAFLFLRLAEVLSLEYSTTGIQKCMQTFLVDQGPLAFSPQWGRDAHPVFWKMVMHNEELYWPKGPVTPPSRNIGCTRGSELHRAELCVRGCLENLVIQSQSLQWRTEVSGDRIPAGVPKMPTSGMVRTGFYPRYFVLPWTCND